MPRVTFVMPSGEERAVDAEPGKSLMQSAVANMIDGVIADCGGYVTCATCHVYVDERFIGTVGEPGSDEVDMLECANDPQPNSRLSCQITLDESMDGLVVRVPAA